MTNGFRSRFIQFLQDRHVTTASIVMEKNRVTGIEFSFHATDQEFRKWVVNILPILSSEIELVVSQSHLVIRCSFSSVAYASLSDLRTESDIDLAKHLIEQTRQALIDLLELKGKGR